MGELIVRRVQSPASETRRDPPALWRLEIEAKEWYSPSGEEAMR
jgi:hypothetical protein